MAADRLGLEPVVDPTARVSGCRLGRCTEAGARTRLAETSLDDDSYIVEDGINPGNHPVERAS